MVGSKGGKIRWKEEEEEEGEPRRRGEGKSVLFCS